MAEFIAAILAIAAVTGLLMKWATSTPETKNNAVNYTIEKLSDLEENIDCDLGHTQYRSLMSAVEWLRPKSFGSKPLPPVRCAFTPPPQGRPGSQDGPPHSENPPPGPRQSGPPPRGSNLPPSNPPPGVVDNSPPSSPPPGVYQSSDPPKTPNKRRAPDRF
jgi:hypothetical protein